MFSRIYDYGKLSLMKGGKLEIRAYANSGPTNAVKAIQNEIPNFIFELVGAELELADLIMIKDVFAAIRHFDEETTLHIILVSADKDFHNLITELKSFSNVKTHALSAQSGSSLTSLADYALEMEKVFKSKDHRLSSPPPDGSTKSNSANSRKISNDSSRKVEKEESETKKKRLR